MIEYLLAVKTLLVETTLQKPSKNLCQDKKLFYVKLFEFILFSLQQANHSRVYWFNKLLTKIK